MKTFSFTYIGWIYEHCVGNVKVCACIQCASEFSALRNHDKVIHSKWKEMCYDDFHSHNFHKYQTEILLHLAQHLDNNSLFQWIASYIQRSHWIVVLRTIVWLAMVFVWLYVFYKINTHSMWQFQQNITMQCHFATFRFYRCHLYLSSDECQANEKRSKTNQVEMLMWNTFSSISQLTFCNPLTIIS